MDEQLDLYSQRRERLSDDAWPRDRLTVASLEEIRYAEQLRLQIRESYQRKAVPPPVYWSVSVD